MMVPEALRSHSGGTNWFIHPQWKSGRWWSFWLEIRVPQTTALDYEDSITDAQEVALKILQEHPAVLKEPESMIWWESLSNATVNIHIYFWIDGSQHSWMKVKSSVIRLTKRAFQSAGISMPDEAREMIFPQGVPVRMLDKDLRMPAVFHTDLPAARTEESASVSTSAEAGLSSEAKTIQEQAQDAWKPEGGENLLQGKEYS